jgi:hypothetical protein
MLDSSNIPELSSGYYPNYWNIKVSRVVPCGTERKGQQGKLIHVMSFTDITPFLTWYSKSLLEHEAVQKKVLSCSNVMEKITLCKQCYAPEAMCACESGFVGLPQSDKFCMNCSENYNECMCTEEIIEEEVQPKKVRRPIRIKRKSRMSTQALTLTNGEMPSYIQCMYTGVLDWFNNDSTYDVNTYVDSLPLHTKLYLWFWLKFYNLVTHFTIINSILMFMLGPNWFIERAFGLNKSFLARHILSYGFYRIKHDLTVPKKLLAITLAIGSGYLLYNMLKKTLDMFVGDTQGGIMSTGSTPPPDTDNKPHVIYEDPFRICVDDLSQQTLCAKGKDLSFLKKTC